MTTFNGSKLQFEVYWVYIGVANHCDNPIQNGRIVAVNLNDGSINGSFQFEATNDRGGGVWSPLSGFLNELYVTTGNTKRGTSPEPSVNHGLSLLQLDRMTGNIDWKFQPVPYALDADPDWASGASIALTDCGVMATSTMKDGWSYAIEGGLSTSTAPVRWQFPPTGYPFAPGDGTSHGDIRYLVPGAVWKDVFITMTAGWNVSSDVRSGYKRLHAFNICSPSSARIRWIKDIPGTSGGTGAYQLGPPSVSQGIVYVGTERGHLVAIADPSRWPASGWRCDHPDLTITDCATNGFSFVPDPSVLLDLDLDPAASDDRILTEPALSEGKIFVATTRPFYPAPTAGKLYMLSLP